MDTPGTETTTERKTWKEQPGYSERRDGRPGYSERRDGTARGEMVQRDPDTARGEMVYLVADTEEA